MPTMILRDLVLSQFDTSLAQLKTSFAGTAEDKLAWSPSPTARTPLMLAANVALGIDSMVPWLDGQPFQYESGEAMDAAMRKQEKEYSTRADVDALLEEKSAAFRRYIESLPDDRLSSPFESELGTYPMHEALGWAAGFMSNRAAQIDYVQTCYGDLSFHTNS